MAHILILGGGAAGLAVYLVRQLRKGGKRA